MNHNKIRNVLRIIDVLCLLVLVSSVAAQQVNYTYDLSGNLAGITTSGAVGPTITAQPRSQLLETNTPVSFSIVANGFGLSYQWLSNGVPIIGATGDSLVLPNLSGSSLPTISVVISNATGVVTSTPAAIWPDSNGNGIPDWWELEYFGNLNQHAGGDYDGDGVDNLDEYLEGTDPANPNSYDPRLYIQTVRGRVVASPDQPYYTMGQAIMLTAIPDGGEMFLGWGGAAAGAKSTIALIMNSHKTVTATFGLPLGVALSNTNLVWTTGGNAPWFGQAEVSEDGVGAAQSGVITANQQSWVQTTVSLSQTNYLSFWWSVSSQARDGLAFSVDGKKYASISGVGEGWQFVQTNLTAGNHTLLWTYSKGSSDSPTGIPFSDNGWVGDVTLSSTTNAPVAPSLNIELNGTASVILYWASPSDGWNLQQNANLGTTNWANVTNAVTVVNGQNQVTITPLSSNQFFRLVSQ